MTASTARSIDSGEQAILEIIKTAELLTRVGNTCVFDREISQARFNILIILKYEGEDGISQNEILQRMVSTKGNLSIHIANLERCGYIRRQASKEDMRRNVVRLTAKGRRVLDKLEPGYEGHIRAISEDLPANRAESLTEMLRTLQERCRNLLNGNEGRTENS